MTGDDDLPDPETFEDMESEDAYRVALLSELTLIRRELTGIRAALEDDRLDTQPDETDHVAKCDKCRAPFETEESAVAHAMTEHDAPTKEAAWRILSEVDA